jgi:hypothetical protein
MFEFSKKAFDEIAVLVEEFTEREAFASIALCRGVGETILRLNACADSVAVIKCRAQVSL